MTADAGRLGSSARRSCRQPASGFGIVAPTRSPRLRHDLPLVLPSSSPSRSDEDCFCPWLIGGLVEGERRPPPPPLTSIAGSEISSSCLSGKHYLSRDWLLRAGLVRRSDSNSRQPGSLFAMVEPDALTYEVGQHNTGFLYHGDTSTMGDASGQLQDTRTSTSSAILLYNGLYTCRKSQGTGYPSGTHSCTTFPTGTATYLPTTPYRATSLHMPR